MYEAQVLSRGIYPVFSPRWILTLFWDWVSVTFSDLVLVESEPQRRYFLKRFGLKEGKVKVLLTGADDSVFFSEDVPKRETFTAIFRGRFLREAGLPVIVEAARLLEEKNIAFLIFGSGHAEHELVESMKKWSPRNLTVDDRHLSYDEMRKLTLSCHVSLGQFASHERLSRTIPHKAYEALALKMPYITSRAEGHQGLLVDHENCLMTDAGSAQSLASALLLLKKDEILRRTLSENGYQTYLSRATPKALGETLNSYLSLLTS
jgi:glycosyltransferase involved in cell wall biosynthesis